MITFQKILYATIVDFQSRMRMQMDDSSFDAFEFLSKKIGHKNPSTLRKMCEPRANGNAAKLGYEEATIIMAETNDYRLLFFQKEQLIARKKEKSNQIDLFSQPLTSLTE
jgi:hypothetical protein